jgi:hypothetical protein
MDVMGIGNPFSHIQNPEFLKARLLPNAMTANWENRVDLGIPFPRGCNKFSSFCGCRRPKTSSACGFSISKSGL